MKSMLVWLLTLAAAEGALAAQEARLGRELALGMALEPLVDEIDQLFERRLLAERALAHVGLIVALRARALLFVFVARCVLL